MKIQKVVVFSWPTQFFMLAAVLFFWTGCNNQSAELTAEKPRPKPHNRSTVSGALPSKQILTRLFWQDRSDGVVYAGDLSSHDSGYQLTKSKVEGFPRLLPSINDLVQMEIANGRLFVGVRGHSDGTKNSGWVEINTGVEEEQHGDHSHWHYSSNAKVQLATLDTKQGNPAHMYRYGNCIYIANDKIDGFTQVRPPRDGGLTETPSESKFFSGGGGHITLAAVANRIAYSTWIDRSGDNAGRVDVVDLKGKALKPKYSFKLPSGGIHGAAACGNRAYFAPSSGVYWVNCDFDFEKNSDSVEIEHLSLDPDSNGSEYRTGAFHAFRNHLFCIANSKSGEPALCVIDGTAPQPKVTRIGVGELKDAKLSGVAASVVSGGKPLAFAFAEGEGIEEKLLVFELDPNGDKCFDDAKLVNSIRVGTSQLEGHFGHHDIAFLGDRKTAVVTNSGDGTLTIIDLELQKTRQTLSVGGKPTSILNFGAAN